MAVLELRRRVKAPRDLVWRVISDIAGMPAHARHINRAEMLEGEQVGMRWRFYGIDGQSWDEECTAWEDGSCYTMRVDTRSYPFSFESLEYSFRVEESGNGVVIKSRYEFQPKFGFIGALLDRAKLRTHFEDDCSELLEQWIRSIHSKEWIYQNTVAVLLNEKGHDVVTAKPDTPVRDVVKLLAEHRIGSVVIVDASGEVAGVLSERDVVRHLGRGSGDVLGLPAADVMTHPAVVCYPDDNMLDVLSTMSGRRFRHLPVVGDDKRMIGIISIGDVVKTRLAELEAESESLRHSIEARRWHEQYVELGPAGLEQEPLTTPGID